MDANDQFESEGSAVGPYGAGRMNTATKMLSELIAAHELTVINTWWPSGATYYANGEGRVLDYIVIPESWRPDVKWFRVQEQSAWRLQAHAQKTLWDHAPLGCEILLECVAEPYE
eukprot:2666677-Pyramimonas_sp.AAC.1